MSLLDKASLIVTPNAYKTSKLYSVIPNTTLGDMDVVRGTTATRVNSAGLIESVGLNIPRIDYTNGSCPSILVEPQRTNLITYSEQFNDASWTKSETTISANVTTSPDGNLTADKFIPNSNNQPHQIRQSGFTSAAYTFSIYAKAAEETTFSLWLRSASVFAIFDLSNGTITSKSSSVIATITSVKNGWYRCSVYDTTPGTTAQLYGRNGSAFTGNGTNGLFIWGAQVELGSYPTSYIPTVASIQTRNADVIYKTGISGLIGQTEGTIFLEIKEVNINSITGYLNLSESSLNRILIYGTSSLTQLIFQVRINNVNTVFSTSYLGMNNITKIAFAYKNGNSSIYINGTKYNSAIDTMNYNFPVSLSKIDLMNYDGSNVADGNLNSAQLYQTRLTDAECIALTTL